MDKYSLEAARQLRSPQAIGLTHHHGRLSTTTRSCRSVTRRNKNHFVEMARQFHDGHSSSPHSLSGRDYGIHGHMTTCANG